MSSLKKIIFVFLFLCIFIAIKLFSIDMPLSKKDYSKGPLFGKNMYIPFLIHYNFDSLSAKSGKKFDFQYHLSTYYIQDEQYKFNEPYPYDPENPTRYYDKANVIRDYESCVSELGFSFNFLDRLQAGINMRIYAYYGGFMDQFIEGFHHAFGFPNGGRQYFLQNQLYINIPNNNGPNMFLDTPTVAFGDIDLWVKYTFFENRYVSLAALGAFKIPTGRFDTLSGSNYPDMAFGLLSDFRPVWFLTFYGQAGIVLPFDFTSYPMFNGLVGLELNPLEIFSINVQMNIKTSPISNNIDWSWNDELGTDFKQYSLPQTNILAGFIFKYKGFRWQFYFEEDAITNQGTDLTVNFTFSHTFSLNPFKINKL